MTGNDDDVDKEQTTKTTWTTTTTKTKERMTRRNTILQMTMWASDIMKYIQPYVFMTGNDIDLDKEQKKDNLDNDNNNKNKRKNDKEEYVDNDSTNDRQVILHSIFNLMCS